MGPNFTPDLLLLPFFHPSLSTRRYSDDSALELGRVTFPIPNIPPPTEGTVGSSLPPVFPAAQSAKISGGGGGYCGGRAQNRQEEEEEEEEDVSWEIH